MISIKRSWLNDEQRERAREISQLEGEGKSLPWNWPAFFLMGFWALSQGLWSAFFRLMWGSKWTYIVLVVSTIIVISNSMLGLLIALAYVAFACGRYGNELNYIVKGGEIGSHAVPSSAFRYTAAYPSGALGVLVVLAGLAVVAYGFNRAARYTRMMEEHSPERCEEGLDSPFFADNRIVVSDISYTSEDDVSLTYSGFLTTMRGTVSGHEVEKLKRELDDAECGAETYGESLVFFEEASQLSHVLWCVSFHEHLQRERQKCMWTYMQGAFVSVTGLAIFVTARRKKHVAVLTCGSIVQRSEEWAAFVSIGAFGSGIAGFAGRGLRRGQASLGFQADLPATTERPWLRNRGARRSLAEFGVRQGGEQVLT